MCYSNWANQHGLDTRFDLEAWVLSTLYSYSFTRLGYSMLEHSTRLRLVRLDTPLGSYTPLGANPMEWAWLLGLVTGSLKPIPPRTSVLIHILR